MSERGECVWVARPESDLGEFPQPPALLRGRRALVPKFLSAVAFRSGVMAERAERDLGEIPQPSRVVTRGSRVLIPKFLSALVLGCSVERRAMEQVFVMGARRQVCGVGG